MADRCRCSGRVPGRATAACCRGSASSCRRRRSSSGSPRASRSTRSPRCTASRRRAADDWLGTVGLEDKADTRTEKLSGGQRQRLSIACALVHDPEVVFLDEPTAALDPQARRNLWDLLTEINSDGRTVVLTTHYLDEAEALCDRVAIMDHGKILRLDTPAALIRSLDAGVTDQRRRGDAQPRRCGRDPGRRERRERRGQIVLATHDPAAVLAELAERDALEGLQVKGATLEDVFLTVTGREYRA